MRSLIIALICLTAINVAAEPTPPKWGWEYHLWTRDEVRQYVPDNPLLVGNPWWMKCHGVTNYYDNAETVGEKPYIVKLVIRNTKQYKPGVRNDWGWTNVWITHDLMSGEWTKIGRFRTHMPRRYTLHAAVWDDTYATRLRESNQVFVKTDGSEIFLWSIIDKGKTVTLIDNITPKPAIIPIGIIAPLEIKEAIYPQPQTLTAPPVPGS
jgi:hypothetical protein